MRSVALGDVDRAYADPRIGNERASRPAERGVGISATSKWDGSGLYRAAIYRELT